MYTEFPSLNHQQVVRKIRSQCKLKQNSTNPELALKNTLKILSQLLQLNRGRIFLWDESAQNLRIKYSYMLSRREVVKGKYEICEGITGDVFDSGRATLVTDVMTEPNYRGKVTPKHVLQENSISYLAVPIAYNGSLFGVLAAELVASADTDVKEKTAMLQLVADSFATIINTYSLCEFAYDD